MAQFWENRRPELAEIDAIPLRLNTKKVLARSERDIPHRGSSRPPESDPLIGVFGICQNSLTGSGNEYRHVARGDSKTKGPSIP